MNDELLEQIRDILKDAKQTGRDTFFVAHDVIYLVRADERRRIREQLLSDEALLAMAEVDWNIFAYGGRAWADLDEDEQITSAEQHSEGMAAALAAIGLTKETPS